jgi:hypothetical protein
MAKGDHKLTKHHCVPQSVSRQGEDEIVRVPYKKHNLYHALLSNLRPEQAITYLVETFFGKDGWGYVELALNEYYKKQGL